MTANCGCPVFPLWPSNDLVFRVILKTVDPTTGAITPVTDGVVQAFLSTSNLPTATPADPSLLVNAVTLGNGVWLIVFDGAILTPTLLNALFATATPYLIIVRPGDIRVFAELVFTPSREADCAA